MKVEPHLEQRGFSPEETAKIIGVGRSLVFAEIKAGRLQARKVGRRAIVLKSEIDRCLDAAPVVIVPAFAVPEISPRGFAGRRLARKQGV